MSPRPKQLSLELGSPPPSTFENFVVASNREAVQRLRELPPALAQEHASDRLIYLWGEVGCGRTHLLHAVCEAGKTAQAVLQRVYPDTHGERASRSAGGVLRIVQAAQRTDAP